MQALSWCWILLAVLSDVWGDLELSEFGEVITVEQETIPLHPWEDLILQTEVPHWDHRKGFPSVRISEWLPVIMQHGDLGE